MQILQIGRFVNLLNKLFCIEKKLDNQSVIVADYKGKLICCKKLVTDSFQNGFVERTVSKENIGCAIRMHS